MDPTGNGKYHGDVIIDLLDLSENWGIHQPGILFRENMMTKQGINGYTIFRQS